MTSLDTKIKHLLAGRCDRCRGLMVEEWAPGLEIASWRCVACGERVDPLILAHREADTAGEKELVPAKGGRSR